MEQPKYVKCINSKSSGYTLNKIYVIQDNGYIITNDGRKYLTRLTHTTSFGDKTRDFTGNSDFKASTLQEYNKQEGILEPVPQVINLYEIY